MPDEIGTVFQGIQRALAGHGERDVLHGLMMSLVTAIGVTAPDLDRAEQILDALPVELKPVLRAKWAEYRQHRARVTDAAVAG